MCCVDLEIVVIATRYVLKQPLPTPLDKFRKAFFILVVDVLKARLCMMGFRRIIVRVCRARGDYKQGQ